MEEKVIGRVTHFFGNLSVAVFLLEAPLRAGDQVHIKGATTDITQTVASMQIDKNVVAAAQPGQEVGVKVEGRVREGDIVYAAA